MKKPKKSKDGSFLVLEGQMYLVTRKNGVEVSEEAIDPELVLQLVMFSLKHGLTLMDKQPSKKIKKK